MSFLEKKTRGGEFPSLEKERSNGNLGRPAGEKHLGAAKKIWKSSPTAGKEVSTSSKTFWEKTAPKSSAASSEKRIQSHYRQQGGKHLLGCWRPTPTYQDTG